jgi:hypothetical protein
MKCTCGGQLVRCGEDINYVYYICNKCKGQVGKRKQNSKGVKR